MEKKKVVIKSSGVSRNNSSKLLAPYEEDESYTELAVSSGQVRTFV